MFTHECLAMDFILQAMVETQWTMDRIFLSGIAVHNKLSHIVMVENMDKQWLSSISMCTW